MSSVALLTTQQHTTCTSLQAQCQRHLQQLIRRFVITCARLCLCILFCVSVTIPWHATCAFLVNRQSCGPFNSDAIKCVRAFASREMYGMVRFRFAFSPAFSFIFVCHANPCSIYHSLVNLSCFQPRLWLRVKIIDQQ